VSELLFEGTQAYRGAGGVMPNKDLYQVDAWDRDGVKSDWTERMLFTDPHASIVTGPCPPFLFGEVVAICPDKRTAEIVAAALNAKGAEPARTSRKAPYALEWYSPLRNRWFINSFHIESAFNARVKFLQDNAIPFNITQQVSVCTK
jgi:hypothetical protein